MKEQQPTRRGAGGWILALAAVAVVAGGALYLRRSSSVVPAQVYAPGSSPIVSVHVASSDPTLGDAHAPVQIIEFSDFACTECASWHASDSVFSKVKESYIDTGKVYYVLKQFPLTQLHPEAQGAALAAACAQDQGKFWEYGDLLYAHQDKLDSASLRSYATQIELDETLFNQCFTAQSYEGDITGDIQDGLAVGVTGTPTLFINGHLEDTDLSWETIHDQIEKALATH